MRRVFLLVTLAIVASGCTTSGVDTTYGKIRISKCERNRGVCKLSAQPRPRNEDIFTAESANGRVGRHDRSLLALGGPPPKDGPNGTTAG